MDNGVTEKFVELLHKYGTDFDRIADIGELKELKSSDMMEMYSNILSSYSRVNTKSNIGETGWTQIKNLHYVEGAFYFDVLVPGPDDTNIQKVGERLKVGKELVLLLKDYEFNLRFRLSVLERLYEALFLNGVFNENLCGKGLTKNRTCSLKTITAGVDLQRTERVDEKSSVYGQQTANVVIEGRIVDIDKNAHPGRTSGRDVKKSTARLEQSQNVENIKNYTVLLKLFRSKKK